VIYEAPAAGGPVRRVTRGWAPRFSPGGRLTFQLAGRLMTTDADGHDRRETSGGYRRITANDVRDGDPAISPDGRTIAFDSGRFGWSEVLLMDARGRHQRRLTRELEGDACCPSWRP
jgi:Tol biopolymer transport system component